MPGLQLNVFQIPKENRAFPTTCKLNGRLNFPLSVVSSVICYGSFEALEMEVSINVSWRCNLHWFVLQAELVYRM